jgi:hypothetical protein
VESLAERPGSLLVPTIDVSSLNDINPPLGPRKCVPTIP